MDLHESGASLHFNFLAIEGVIGVGKTSLCRLLGESWNAALILEEVDENPFLSRFYRERDAYAFQTQLWFLLSRYRQLSESGIQQDLFHKVTISDYLFAKDRIFASLNLDGDELQMYNLVAAALEPKVPSPDLVVYLQASTDTLLRRIDLRSRACEAGIDPEYIDALNSAYNHFFFHYDKTPLLVINTDELDFIEEQGDLEEIGQQIRELRRGVLYYKPLPSKDKAALREKAADEE